MSVFSRALLAGAMCAALSAPILGAQAFAAPTADDPGSTGGRLAHASKCVLTLGFSGGCDKDEASAKRKEREAAEEKVAGPKAAVTKAVDEHSTRHQLANASKCVVSFGFAGNCDKSDPDGSAKASVTRTAEREPKAPDHSTAGQFKHAGACVISFGFLGDCDRK
jgi:hypothetical protein